MEQETGAKQGRKVTVLGAGAFGTALGGVLEENGYRVAYYDPVLEVLLEDALAGAEAIVLAAPSAAVWELTPRLPKNLTLVVATKGLLSCEAFLEFGDFQVLSGPAFARELKEHQETVLTATGKVVAELFERPYLKFDFTTDKVGVLLCGALKNVYAILAGQLQLEPGTEKHAEFLAEVKEEMEAILTANGGEAETFGLSCGVGDLALTCSTGSRNYRFGRKLAQDPKTRPEETVEGVSTLKRIGRGELVVPPEAIKLRGLVEESEEWE